MGKAVFATAAGVFLGSGLVYAAYTYGPGLVTSALAYIGG